MSSSPWTTPSAREREPGRGGPRRTFFGFASVERTAATNAGDVSSEETTNETSETSDGRRRPDDLVLTEACVSRLLQLAAEETAATRGDTKKEPNPPLLRIAVDGGGCSGFQYAFSLDADACVGPRDFIFEKKGARVVVDDVSFEFLKGATVDYVEEMIKSSFAIAENPNSDGSCGCGVSFAAK